MEDWSETRERRWLPVLTGVLVGLALAALALALVMTLRVRSVVQAEVGHALKVQGIAGAGADLPLGDGTGPVGYPEGSAAANAAIDASRRTAIVQAVERVSPAVVSIITKQVERYMVRSAPRSLAELFFGRGQAQVRERPIFGIGSGVIVSETGRVVTNNHVVADAEELTVTLSDGRQYPARRLDTSARYDVALIQMELPAGETVPVVRFGDSDELQIGEWAIALGSPFGLELNATQPSVTVGVISALNRDVQAAGPALYTEMIQTDADINPGNSGGPLVNAAGEVVGINTLIFTKDGTSLGIGFARPINTVSWVLDEFEKYGKVRDKWAGFEAMTLQPFHVRHYDLKATRGLFVTRVFTNGPGAKAGLEPGDVIVEIEGTAVERAEQGRAILFRYEVGDDVRMVIDRAGERIPVTLHFEPYPEDIQE